jgi:hypothetical protein
MAPSWKELFSRIARWGERPARPTPAHGELHCYSAEEVDRLARLLGVPSVELRVVETERNAELLNRRMAALGLDPNEFAGLEPALMRDMQGLCTQCESRTQCLDDFARHASDPTWEGWRQYCPNQSVLNMLNILQKCGRPEPKSPFPFVA